MVVQLLLPRVKFRNENMLELQVCPRGVLAARFYHLRFFEGLQLETHKLSIFIVEHGWVVLYESQHRFGLLSVLPSLQLEQAHDGFASSRGILSGAVRMISVHVQMR